MHKTLIWFRNDLRLKDNPALVEAAKNGVVLPIYILDTDTPSDIALGGASKWWLHHALIALNEQLEGNLRVYKGDAKAILLDICEQHKITQVMWNRRYEPWAIARDTEIKATLKAAGYEVTSYNGSLLWEPMKVLKQDGSPYKVYTPYFKNGCLNCEAPRYPLAAPEIEYCDTNDPQSVSAEQLELLPKIKWDTHMCKLWDVSESGGQDRLAAFIKNGLTSYQEQRNLPAIVGTSQISPYLAFGLLSPNQAWYAVLDAQQGSMEHKSVYTYLSELGWREFAYYLLFHFEDIKHTNVSRKFDKFPWLDDAAGLKAWQRGNTGVPIVDAGMRELWQTGYMHNRVRMIVASYLVKNLLIDWREGEKWFWDCLLDADPGSNAASWQWVAGSGADAAPYFRIFNPVLQGEKFDKSGDYVRQYCPELKDMPNKYLHKPWEASADILQQANIVLGKTYPNPLVCLKQSRQRALAAYGEIK